MQPEIKTLKVSDKGQISIPSVIRQKLGINRGDPLILIELDGKLLLEKPSHIANQLKDDFLDITKASEDSLKEVWDNAEDEIWSDYLKQ